jgi:hypothetical protein
VKVLDANNPLNKPVVDYLHSRNPSQPSFAAHDSVSSPYMNQGSHPDIVERVWDQIGSALPVDCRCLVCGTPALVQPDSGIILAFCLGMAYCLRLPSELLEEAIKHGAKTSTKWSNGTVLDATKTFGPDWIFGAWKEEVEWCRKTYDAYNESLSDS